MCSEGFYARPQADQAALLAKLEAARGVAAKLVARWTELEERRDG
jgi:hypothetical protein